jgi:hypothetical protein
MSMPKQPTGDTAAGTWHACVGKLGMVVSMNEIPSKLTECQVILEDN